MKAAELIPQIRAAYADLMKAETEGFGQTLFHAIELGTLLSQAKADPDVGAHAKWEKWLAAQSFGFSIRKAQRCMRYANHKGELEVAAKTSVLTDLVADHRLGICDADALLRKPKVQGGTKQPKAKPKPDLTEILKNEGADVIKTALKQADKFDELAAVVAPPFDQQLKYYPTSRLAVALIGVWNTDQVQALIQELTARLKSAAGSPPPGAGEGAKPTTRPTRELGAAATPAA
jgi:hypothetical protein